MRNVPCRAGGGVLIIISNITLPTFVYTMQSFLLSVEILELSDERLIYSGTFYAGQEVMF